MVKLENKTMNYQRLKTPERQLKSCCNISLLENNLFPLELDAHFFEQDEAARFIARGETDLRALFSIFAADQGFRSAGSDLDLFVSLYGGIDTFTRAEALRRASLQPFFDILEKNLFFKKTIKKAAAVLVGAKKPTISITFGCGGGKFSLKKPVSFWGRELTPLHERSRLQDEIVYLKLSNLVL